MSTRSVKLVALSVGVAVIGLGVAVACAQAQPVPKPGPRVADPFPVTTVVVFDAKAKTVTPVIALLRKDGKVDLEVRNLAGRQTLEIDFRVQGAPSVKGPFAKTQTWRGRYTFTANDKTTTGPVDVPGPVVWKYDVVLREQDNTDIWAIDPVIVVRE